MADIRIVPSAGAINVTGSADFRGTGGSTILYLTGSGQIGAGTTNPDSEFHIVGSGTRFVTLDRSGTRSYDLGVNSSGTFLVTDNTVSADRIALNHSGSVGIGTTNPLSLLHIRGSEPAIRIVDTDDSSTSIIGSSGGYTYIRPFSRDFRVIDDAGVGLLTVKPGGSVGIGTTSPSVTLDVIGKIRSVNANDQLTIKRSDNTGTRIGHDALGLYFANDDASLTVLRIYGGTSGAERFVIGSGGAVKLSSYGSGTFTGTAAKTLAVDSSGNVIEINNTAIDGSGTANYVTKWSDSDSLTNSIIFDEGTNIGIGTTTPTAKVHILYGGDNNPGLRLQGDGNDTHLEFRANNNYATIQAYDSGFVNVGTLALNPTGGSVSIGTTLKAVGGAPGGGSGSLNVYTGTGAGSWGQQIRHDSTTGNGLFIRAGDSSTYYTAYFTGYDENNVHFVVKGDGTLGVATSSPTARVDIASAPAQSTVSTLGYRANAHINLGIPNTVGDVAQIVFTNAAAPTAGYASIGVIMTSGAGVGLGDIIMATKSVGADAVSTERFRITSGGNVGIGTTSPLSQLHIYSSATTGTFRIGGSNGAGNSRIAIDAAGENSYIDSYGDSAYKPLAIEASILKLNANSGGNVGVGYSAPVYQLQVLNNIGLRANSQNFQAIKGTGWGYSPSSYKVVMLGDSNPSNFTTVSIGYDPSSNANPAFTGGGGEVLFRRGVKFVTPNAADDSFFLDNLVLLDGNVGIGTNNPNHKLVVAGNMAVSASNTEGAIWFGDGQSIGLYRNNTYDLVLSQEASSGNPLYLAGAGNVVVSIDSNNNETDRKFIIGNNAVKASNELFSVNESGNVYIGNDLTVTGKITAREFHTTFVSASIIYQSGSTKFGDSSDDIHHFTGKVGVNVSDPQAPLEVMGTSNTPADGNEVISVTNTIGGTKLLLGVVENSYGWIQAAEGGSLRNLLLNPNGANVGIGTTNPLGALHVYNGGSERFLVGGDVQVVGATDLDITGANRRFSFTSGNGTIRTTNATSLFLQTNSTTALTIDSNQNVGIGISTPSYRLSISGSVGIEANEEYVYFHSNYSVGSNARAKIRAVGAGGGSGYGGDFRISTRATNNVWNEDVVTVDSSGRVGISTTAPGGILTVQGTSGQIVIGSSWTSGNHDILFSGGSASNTGTANGTAARIRSVATAPGGAATGDLLFTVNSGDTFVDAIYITGSGNVGVGTNSPISKLDVNGSIQAGSGNTFGIGVDGASIFMKATSGVGLSGNFAGYSRNLIKTDGTSVIEIGDPTTSIISAINISAGDANGAISLKTGGNNIRLYVSASGDVGIGTSNPTAKLDIRSKGLDTNPLSIYGTTSGAKMFDFRDDSVSGTTAAMFRMYNASGTETVRLFPGTTTGHHSWILPTGNMGIGTNAPAYKLDVNGTFRATSGIVADSFTGTNSSTSGTMALVYADQYKSMWTTQASFTWTGAGVYNFNLVFAASAAGGFHYDLVAVTSRNSSYRNFGTLKDSSFIYWESDGDFHHRAEGDAAMVSTYAGGMYLDTQPTAFLSDTITGTSENGTSTWDYYIVRYSIYFPDNTTGSNGYFRAHLTTYGMGSTAPIFISA